MPPESEESEEARIDEVRPAIITICSHEDEVVVQVCEHLYWCDRCGAISPNNVEWRISELANTTDKQIRAFTDNPNGAIGTLDKVREEMVAAGHTINAKKD